MSEWLKCYNKRINTCNRQHIFINRCGFIAIGRLWRVSESAHCTAIRHLWFGLFVSRIKAGPSSTAILPRSVHQMLRLRWMMVMNLLRHRHRGSIIVNVLVHRRHRHSLLVQQMRGYRSASPGDQTRPRAARVLRRSAQRMRWTIINDIAAN